MLILDEAQVRRFLTYEQLLPALEQALVRYSRGQTQQPVRSVLPISEKHGLCGLMPAIDGDLIGIKIVTVFERNQTLPTHQAVIQLFSAATGEPLAVMDGRLITEMRTAAVSAIATRLFARRGAEVLTILGSGVQARAHLQALRLVHRFREVRVWSRTPEDALRFAREYGARAMECDETLRGADVIIGASGVSDLASGERPAIRGDLLKPDAFVAAIGAIGLGKRELDDAALDAAVVVESRDAALKESGDISGSGAAIYAELGEVLAGDKPKPDRRVVYKGLGIAAEDLCAARLVYEAVLGEMS